MQENIKQDYINMRNSGNFDLNVFWRMYKSQGGLINNPQEFSSHFLNEIESLGNGMEIRNVRDRASILISVDKKLELTGLYSAEGQFIKIVC